MKKLVEQYPETQSITPEERNLLSVAYKNVVGSLRSAWRVLLSIYNKAETKPDYKPTPKDLICEEYQGTIKKELDDVCHDLIVSFSCFICMFIGILLLFFKIETFG